MKTGDFAVIVLPKSIPYIIAESACFLFGFGAALMDPAKVSDEGGTLWYTSPGWIVYKDPETEIYTDGSGKAHMRYTFVSDSPFPEGSYSFYPETVGRVDDYNTWEAWSLYMKFNKTS